MTATILPSLDAIQARAVVPPVCIDTRCDEPWCQSRRDNLALVKVARAVLDLHRDGGPSQGYTSEGYRTIDHCCTECGSFGEYGVPWPCPTVLVVAAHIDTTPKEKP